MPNEIACYLEKKQCGAVDVQLDSLAAEARSSPIVAAATEDEDALYRSISVTYHMLRLLMAGVALVFPLALWLRTEPRALLASLSAYYHYDDPASTAYGAGDARDIFVGVLWAVGAALVVYRGYSRREDWALNLAGLCAIAVALFPMDWMAAGQSWTDRLHYAAALIFFLMIAFVCLAESRTTLALVRDGTRRRALATTYKVLGALMIALPTLAVALHLLSEDRANAKTTWLVEVSGIEVFALFWAVKSWEIRKIEQEAGLTQTVRTA
jgi:hypothetical protein